MSDILVVGWILLDLVGHVDALPDTSGPVLASDLDAACGGRAASQAMAITAIEGEVALIARLGTDQHAGLLQEELLDLGVGSDHVTPAPAMTGMRLVAQRGDGAAQITVFAGANDYLTVDDLNRRASAFSGAKAVGVTTEPAGSVVLRALELAKGGGAVRVLTHTSGTHVSDGVLAAADVVVVAARHARGLLDPVLAEEQPEAAARALCQRGAPAVALLTSSRLMLAHPDGVRELPCPNPLDTEDATDAFVGGLLVGLALGETMQEACHRGVRISALLVD